MLIKIISKELSYFHALNQKAKNLIISFIAYNLAAPLIGIFTNAYIWRQNHDLLSIGLFNAAWMIGVTTAFILNGYLLRWFSLTWLYSAGLFLQAAACLVLFIASNITTPILIVIGFFLGSMAGLYWANRNLLTLQLTDSTERNYFCSLESALAMMLGVVSPFLFGWFLELGKNADTVGIIERYRLLMLIMLFLQLIGVFVIVKSKFHDVTPNRIFLRASDSNWKQARLFTALKGVAEGSGIFLPTLIILHLIGEEGALGTLQSIAVLSSCIMLYFVARFMNTQKRYSVLSAGVALVVLSGLILSLAYSALGGIFYIILNAMGIQLIWAAANPIMFDCINLHRGSNQDSYQYIVDREIFLNLGRLTGILLMVIGIFTIGEEICLRITPLCLALLTSLLLISARKLIFSWK